MSDEYESLNSRIPDFGAALAQRVSQKTVTSSPTTFDPYKEMLKKKNEDSAPVDPSTIRKWPEADEQKLQDYCQKMGIIGFNSGKLSPIVALAMLKRQFGEDFTGVPLEERVPHGYGPNNTYSQTIQKKQILHG